MRKHLMSSLLDRIYSHHCCFCSCTIKNIRFVSDQSKNANFAYLSEKWKWALAERIENNLSWWSFVFSWEAITHQLIVDCDSNLLKFWRMQMIFLFDYISWRKVKLNLHNNSLIDEGWLLLSTTKHVDHVFHRHLEFILLKIII